ncbi:hypothetical protein [Wenzhouxiangella sediminis]|uniref:Uncharacterized protein n=1 Tax=Wenzhouxiangella sediminis TaxID=1792836 RepID=A0A3E1KAB9_9GAMM|nr:hypothetical protein [Wenzhouxiangella sediminis]RFF30695.1 hypothetical protein DZC52_07120 [Wenzhouxiangella sediminis]
MSSARNSVLPTRFRYRLSPVNMKRGLWIVFVSLAVLIGLGMLGSESLGETILEDLQEQPAWALGAALVGIVALVALIGRIVSLAREAWLTVDSSGIQCSPHKHHGPRNWLRQDWQLPWSAIDKAIVQRPGPKAQHVQSWINTTLTLESGQGQHDLALLLWDPVDDPLERPGLTAFRPGTRLHEMTETHPLIRHLEQRGIEIDYQPLGFRGRWGMGKPSEDRPEAGAGDAPVDLFNFKSLVLMLSLMGAIAVAAALHFMVLPPIRPLWSPAWGMMALAGSAVFLAGALLPRAAPVRERTVVALLLGATVGALAHPLSVRLEAMTAEAPQTVDYVVAAPGVFEPIDSGLPALDLSDLEVPEYWNSLPDGEIHPFDLQRTGESRYVLRLGPLFERTRAFYAGREAD